MLYKVIFPYDSPILVIITVVAALWFSNDFSTKFSSSKPDDNILSTCRLIARIISNDSNVHWPGSSDFDSDVHHWAESSSDKSRCSIRPGSIDDLSKIIQMLGWTKTPFAVSGGGHALNPGFSSTTGVHISMSNFTTLNWNREQETIDIGAGLRWDHVYDYLNPQGYTVVGGRVRGVGVAGFILGGGLSYKTNRYGLTIDTLQSCEIVLPNGTVAVASHDENPDLFFGLKGGFNNFGIVTRFTLKVFQQDDIWGGTVILGAHDLAPAHELLAKFQQTVRDPLATVNIIYEFAEGEMNAIIILFYDAPQPPAGLFDDFLNLPNGKVSVASMSFQALLDAGQPRNTPRRIQDVAPFEKFTPTLLDKIANETLFWGGYLEKFHSGHFFDYIVEIFLPDYYSHGPPSAWPPNRDITHMILDVAFAWYEKSHDEAVYEALKKSMAKLRDDAEGEGQILENASLYPNLPIADTPMDRMYGRNLGKLRLLRDRYDPKRVMDLTGGWKF